MAGPTNPIARAFLAAPVLLFRLRLGAVFGGRMLLLETVGRKTGRVRRVVIEVVKADRAHDRFWVVAGWGRSTGWYRNALANPPRLVDTGRRRFPATATELDLAARRDLLTEYQREHPTAARAIGARLLGEEFTGDPEALDRLAERLGALLLEPRA
ncbi:MAG: nitroreductase family deazaflavin-dependent oxidoreductase [Actinomycetales bacterium]|nr:nitroreductase family deazaflavin-dependent oxidoreductase [Actinomycetales bacterium]